MRSAPELCQATKKHPPRKNEGRRSAGRRNVLEPRHTSRCCHQIVRGRGGGLKRQTARLSALHRGARKAVTPWLNPGPRFLELPGANGRTLPGASAASTSQTGPSAGRYDARSRPGAVCETARGDRTRCRNQDRIRNAPFTSELCLRNHIGDENQYVSPCW